MQLIKNGQILDDQWQHLSDVAPLSSGDITVSFARWSDEKETLKARSKGQIGIRLNGDDPLETLEPELDQFAIIALEFPAFTDGRCFSFARTLRQRFHYAGEIRAVGDFLRDQLYYMSRVGIDAFEFADRDAAEKALVAFKDFSVNYQVSSDSPEAVRHRISH